MSVESEAYEYIHPSYNKKENKKTETDLCSKDAYESKETSKDAYEAKEIKIIWYYFYDKRYNEICRAKEICFTEYLFNQSLEKIKRNYAQYGEIEVYTYMLKPDNKTENEEHTLKNIDLLGNESNLEIKFLDSKNRKREAVSAIFCLDGSWFYADLVNLPFIGNECMIFEANESGEVTDWSELYCDRSMDEVSKENLILCINEFVQSI